jgi:hypothetical protein
MNEATSSVIQRKGLSNVLGIDVSHLISESLGDTDDQVVLQMSANIPGRVSQPSFRDGIEVTYDESADGSEGSDALSRSVVELDLDEVLLGLRYSQF